MNPSTGQGWYSDTTATLGDRLTGAREAMGLDQAELARRIGVDEAVIHAWEADMREPRGNRMQMLAGMLNISLMWLLCGEGDGLEAPGDGAPSAAQNGAAILGEIRSLRQDIGAISDRLSRLESRLKLALPREAA